MIFSQSEARVEFALDHAQKEKSKAMFDALFAKKEQIEKRFGTALSWRRMDENRASLIVCAHDFDGYNQENWETMIAWLVDHIRRLEKAFDPEIAALRQIVRA